MYDKENVVTVIEVSKNTLEALLYANPELTYITDHTKVILCPYTKVVRDITNESASDIDDYIKSMEDIHYVADVTKHTVKGVVADGGSVEIFLISGVRNNHLISKEFSFVYMYTPDYEGVTNMEWMCGEHSDLLKLPYLYMDMPVGDVIELQCALNKDPN